MRIDVEQRFSGALADVEAALVDPAYIARLAELPKLGTPDLLSQERDEGRVHQRVRYRFVGDLNAAVRRVVDPGRLTWVEVSVVDLVAHRTEWHIEPDHYATLLHARGTFVLDQAADQTRRRASIDLRVSFPMVGGRVERAIASGLREHAALEEQAMAEWLADSSH